MIGMPTILSIRQRLDAGDSVAQVARDEGGGVGADRAQVPRHG